MIEIRQTAEFSKWLTNLADLRAQERINKRIVRLEGGLFGDIKFLVASVKYASIGPGYRLYFVRRGNTVVILLCGGDKATQERDIRRAMSMAKDW